MYFTSYEQHERTETGQKQKTKNANNLIYYLLAFLLVAGAGLFLCHSTFLETFENRHISLIIQ